MRDEFDRAKDLFRWSERVFGFLGAWPLKSSYERFTICAVYYTGQIIMQSVDMYCVLGDFQLMVENFSESAFTSLILMKLLCIRFSRKIVSVVQRVLDGVDAKLFDSPDERAIYLKYNRDAKHFFKLWAMLGCSTSFVYYFTPLLFLVQAGRKNESEPFILPYRIRLFFEINDSTTFYLTWLYQAPMTYFSTSHTIAIGFVYSLVLHVCGLLGVLAFRIRNVDLGDSKQPEAFRILFQDIVHRQRIIIELANDINAAFGAILLVELVLTTVLIGLTCYVGLTNMVTGGARFLSCIMFGLGLLSLIYGYCEAGEYLIAESTNLHTAYYQCLWYDMPISFKRQLLICMIGTSKPLQFTGGGIYLFCLPNFMSITKTAAGYISMLQTMI